MSQHSELTREDWQEMDFTPIESKAEPEQDMCVCCGEHPVTWPRVCENCQDKEAQAELSMRYENEGVEASFMTCRNCGMIYDGGQFCFYCGDTNPTDDWDDDEEFERDYDDDYVPDEDDHEDDGHGSCSHSLECQCETCVQDHPERDIESYSEARDE